MRKGVVRASRRRRRRRRRRRSYCHLLCCFIDQTVVPNLILTAKLECQLVNYGLHALSDIWDEIIDFQRTSVPKACMEIQNSKGNF
jgi:hypothetical protein